MDGPIPDEVFRRPDRILVLMGTRDLTHEEAWAIVKAWEQKHGH